MLLYRGHTYRLATAVSTAKEAQRYCRQTAKQTEGSLRAMNENAVATVEAFNRWVEPLVAWAAQLWQQVGGTTIQRREEQRKLDNLRARARELSKLAVKLDPAESADRFGIRQAWDRLDRIPRLVDKLVGLMPRVEDYAARPKQLQHGDFQILNRYGYTTEEMAEPLAVLDAATAKISAAGFDEILYGVISLVAKVKQSGWVGWYNASSDWINLAQQVPQRFSPVYTLTHEFGHRVWYKLLNEQQRHQYDLAYSTSARYRLTVDDRQRWWDLLVSLDFDTRRLSSILPAEEAEALRHYWFERTTRESRRELQPGVFSDSARQRRVDSIGQHQFICPKKLLVYPETKGTSVTPYGDTKVEEDFAEIFAHVVLGMPVKPEVRQRYDAVLGKTRQTTAVTREAKWEQYDIAATAAELNQRAFAGKLDLSFPMVYRALKPVYGAVYATWQRLGKPTPKMSSLRSASAIDAAGSIIRNDDLSEASWPDLAELLTVLEYRTEPRVWYYTTDSWGTTLIGLDHTQRARNDGQQLVFWITENPGGTPKVELGHPVQSRSPSPRWDSFASDLRRKVLLKAMDAGLEGKPFQSMVLTAANLVKKFPENPEPEQYWTTEQVSRTVDGQYTFYGTFWRSAAGSLVTSPAGKSFFVPFNDNDPDPAALRSLWSWLEKQKFKTVLKLLVRGTSAAKPRLTKERTIENTGTCSICLGNFKMDRRGYLVLHGYERKGYGHVEGDCIGTHHQPYEVSDEACQFYQDRLLKSITSIEQRLAKFKQAVADGTLDSLPDSRNNRGENRRGVPYAPVKPGDPRWEIEMRSYPHGMEQSLASLDSLLKYNARLLKAWKPRPLPGQPGFVSVGNLLVGQHGQERDGTTAMSHRRVKYRGMIYRRGGEDWVVVFNPAVIKEKTLVTAKQVDWTKGAPDFPRVKEQLANHSAKLVTAAPVYVYHGTAAGADDSLLKRILKEGLNPDPKRKTFTNPNPSSNDQHARELATYGGVYFAYNVSDTTKYMLMAHQQIGGDEVLVIARVETRSPAAAPDEDVFGSAHTNLLDDWLLKTSGHLLTGYNAAGILLDKDFPWEKAAREIAQDLVSETTELGQTTEGWLLKPQQIDAIIPSFVDLLVLNVHYRLLRDYGDGTKSHFSGDVYSWYAQASPEQKDIRQVLKQYRQVHDQLLRKFKALVVRPHGFRGSYHTFRVTEPVAYSGANRIVAVVRIHEPEDAMKGPYYKIVTVLYRTAESTAPLKEAMSKLLERWSQNMRWVDKDGTVLYDQPRKIEKAAGVRQAGLPYSRVSQHTATIKGAVTLWRAAKDDLLVGPTAFTQNKETALLYLTNLGFGGPQLYRTKVTLDPNKVCDLSAETIDSGIDVVCNETGLLHPGAVGIDWWVMQDYVADALLDRGYDWAVVPESYPSGSLTFVWLGGDQENEPELFPVPFDLRIGTWHRTASLSAPTLAEQLIHEIRSVGKPMGKRLTSTIYLFGGTSSVELVPTGPHEVYLQRIRTYEAGGKGSATLKLLTQAADRLGVDLVLVVNPFDNRRLDAGALAAWYARHGFLPDPGAEEKGTMTRSPRRASFIARAEVAPSRDVLRRFIIAWLDVLYEAQWQAPNNRGKICLSPDHFHRLNPDQALAKVQASAAALNRGLVALPKTVHSDLAAVLDHTTILLDQPQGFCLSVGEVEDLVWLAKDCLSTTDRLSRNSYDTTAAETNGTRYRTSPGRPG